MHLITILHPQKSRLTLKNICYTKVLNHLFNMLTGLNNSAGTKCGGKLNDRLEIKKAVFSIKLP